MAEPLAPPETTEEAIQIARALSCSPVEETLYHRFGEEVVRETYQNARAWMQEVIGSPMLNGDTELQAPVNAVAPDETGYLMLGLDSDDEAAAEAESHESDSGFIFSPTDVEWAKSMIECHEEFDAVPPPQGFDVQQSKVILEAMRRMAGRIRPVHEGERRAALEYLSNRSPLRTDRALSRVALLVGAMLSR
jgi:hypothetical protein